MKTIKELYNSQDVESSIKNSKAHSSKGLHHWLRQRLTAVFLVPLSIWFIYFLSKVNKQPIDVIFSIIKQPGTVTGLTVLICTVFYHASLGMQVIIEDYVHNISLRNILIRFVKYISLFTVISQVSMLLYMLLL